jgi:hypothetical protein
MPARRAAAPETSGQVSGFDLAQVAAAFKQVPHPAPHFLALTRRVATPDRCSSLSDEVRGRHFSPRRRTTIATPSAGTPQLPPRPCETRRNYSRLSVWLDARVIGNHAAEAEAQRQKLEFIAARFRRLMLGSQAYLTSSGLENSNFPE